MCIASCVACSDWCLHAEYIAYIVGTTEYQLVPKNRKPPPALYVPPAVAETAEEDRVLSQADINELRADVPNETKDQITDLTEKIYLLNEASINAAAKLLGTGRTMDEPVLNEEVDKDTDKHEIKTWYLGALGLRKLPPSLGKVKVTGDLILFGNQLKEIAALPNVRGKIDLSLNPISKLPDTLNQLHLKELNLLACRLRSLPESFAKMRIDGDLTIAGNPLNRPFPKGIKTMQIGGTVWVDKGQMKSPAYNAAFGKKMKEFKVGAASMCGMFNKSVSAAR